MNIAVLGSGMVGSVIAIDLSSHFDVTCFDISDKNLRRLGQKANVKIKLADLSNFASYPQMLEGFDLVASAVPGFIGYRVLEAVIRAKKNVVDISFFPEDGLLLDGLAKEMGVTAIIDCGVAPGMSNIILGRCNEIMDIDSFECMVGGLPKARLKPFEYKAPFSPIDVIEEYIRPARYVENGHIVTKAALSDPELLEFEDIGTLECFNTDGLRSLLFTMSHIPNLKEKTLRYPGHIQLIIALKKAGFFDTKIRNLNGYEIRPIDFTSALLFDQWRLQPGEAEFTVMKIIIKGRASGQATTIEYFLYDEYDHQTGISSMSRTTAYTCTAALHLLAKDLFDQKGIIPPELLGKSEPGFDFILSHLAERKVNYKRSEVPEQR